MSSPSEAERVERLAFWLFTRFGPPGMTPAKRRQTWTWLPQSGKRQWIEDAQAALAAADAP
jgi:hypothetical protein